MLEREDGDACIMLLKLKVNKNIHPSRSKIIVSAVSFFRLLVDNEVIQCFVYVNNSRNLDRRLAYCFEISTVSGCVKN